MHDAQSSRRIAFSPEACLKKIKPQVVKDYVPSAAVRIAALTTRW
jgi:hypothetical protein